MRHRIAAYRELLSHYRKVFGHFWRQRAALGGAMLTTSEAEFLPAALSLQETPVSSTARLTGRVLMALIGLVLLWAVLGKVDIIVNAEGKIIPSARVKTIASVDIASVRTINVSEGQHVKAGEVLVELDTSASDAERDKAIGDQVEATLEVARAKALIAALESGNAPSLPSFKSLQATHGGVTLDEWKAEQIHLNGLYRDFRAKLQRADGDIDRYARALPLATQRAQDYHSLLQYHDVAEHAWLEKEQARIDLEGQLADAKYQRAALVAETRRAALEQLTASAKIAASSRQDAIRSDSHSKLLRLTSPINGTVQQLTVHTVGGVVPAAQALMQIVPSENAVEVEAFLENKDIGFVREGQNAEVKIDAFEYSKYGTVPAKVTRVSHDAIQDEKKGLLYTTKVSLSKNSIVVDGQLMPLSAGMAVNVELKTGERRIIEYVLSPLVTHQREALHER